MGLREELLRLLKTDEEFRYAVAGLLGYEELLKRAGRQEKQIRRLRQQMEESFTRVNEALAKLTEATAKLTEAATKHEQEIAQLRREMIEGFKRHDEEIAQLRKEMLEGFKRHDELLARHSEEIAQLRREMIEGFKRHDELLAKHGEEIARLRAEMLEGFKRHDELLARHSEEIAQLRREMIEGFKRHDEEIAQLRKEMLEGFKRHDVEILRLREDMNRGFSLLERHLSALGARWGLMAEEAFREGLRGLLAEELGLTVEKWRTFDESGRVFGYPSEVDIDVAVKDGKVILIEVASHVKASDVYQFKRKAELYEEKTGRKPDRLLIITPYADQRALEASKRFNIEVYTKV